MKNTLIVFLAVLAGWSFGRLWDAGSARAAPTESMRTQVERQYDANGDAELDITDPLMVLEYLFIGGSTPVVLAQSSGTSDQIADLVAQIADLRDRLEPIEAVAHRIPSKDENQALNAMSFFDVDGHPTLTIKGANLRILGDKDGNQVPGRGNLILGTKDSPPADATGALVVGGEDKSGVLQHLSLEGESHPSVRITGANLHVVNGLPPEENFFAIESQEVNGLGNIIVGYQYDDGSYEGDYLDAGEGVGGSHNIVIGRGVTAASYGAIVAGRYSVSSAPYASVLGGIENEVSGIGSVIVSGGRNDVSGGGSVVVTGSRNRVSGAGSGIGSGGIFRRDEIGGNAIGGDHSWIGGGLSNRLGGSNNVILGGDGRLISSDCGDGGVIGDTVDDCPAQ
jgi:hypothetical protein